MKVLNFFGVNLFAAVFAGLLILATSLGAYTAGQNAMQEIVWKMAGALFVCYVFVGVQSALTCIVYMDDSEINKFMYIINFTFGLIAAGFGVLFCILKSSYLYSPAIALGPFAILLFTISGYISFAGGKEYKQYVYMMIGAMIITLILGSVLSWFAFAHTFIAFIVNIVLGALFTGLTVVLIKTRGMPIRENYSY